MSTINAKVISKRIREAMEAHDLSQADVCRLTGFSSASLSQYSTGRSQPLGDRFAKLAKALNVSEEWLAGANVPMSRNSTPVTINVLGRVAAGIPIDAIEEIVDTEEITAELARTGTFFGLKIHGDSMAPRMLEGDTIIVKAQPDADSGDVVVVRINGDYACCKKLLKADSGITLLSFNPAYEPMIYSNEEIMSIPVEIIGVVVENRQKYK